MRVTPFLVAVQLCLPLAVRAADPVPMGWGVAAMTPSEFQKRDFQHRGKECFWIGPPSDALKHPRIYAHPGPFAFHTHFPLDFPAGSTPRLLVNGLADGTVAQLNGKPIALVKERNKGADPLATERCFSLPPELLKKYPGHNCLILWSSAIRKERDDKVTPVSKIVFDDPDALEARERQKRSRAPYLHEETEDPYVARHW